MPTIFILALVAFIVLVALIVLIAVAVLGFRPSRDGHVGPSSGPTGSDFTNFNP
jgi:hypothetical protein